MEVLYGRAMALGEDLRDIQNMFYQYNPGLNTKEVIPVSVLAATISALQANLSSLKADGLCKMKEINS